MTVSSLTVCIATYNRARLLRETLDALQAMTPPAECRVDIVIVDNNSSDDTRAAVEAASAGPFPIRYVHEARQGKSFALNAALTCLDADVVALTDDDVVPDRDWIARIVQRFRERPVTFVFGRVLPRWAVTPPPELLTRRARDVWGPLALLDYGDEPVIYIPQSTAQPLPIGANLAFARSALVAIGGWRTDLGKVNNTLISGEDHEIFMRLRRKGLFGGCYDPGNVVRHYVPAERLTRRYFRRWFFWHGKTAALMLDDLFPSVDMARVPRIAGVPRFLYRLGLAQLVRLFKTIGRSAPLDALIEESRALHFAGLFLECWRRRLARSLKPRGKSAPRNRPDGTPVPTTGTA